MKQLLRDWNALLLQDKNAKKFVSSGKIKERWLGYSGATISDMADAETKLGRCLPPSFKKFLELSNGWAFVGNPNVFPGALLSCDSLRWFRKDNQQWIDAYTEPYRGEPEPTDDEHFVYGEKQDCAVFRTRYLAACLQISEVSGGGVYLLNPEVTTNEGEWEAWHFANYLPGALRYRTFHELLTQVSKGIE